MEDVQGLEDGRKIAINRVGIKDVRYPVTIGDKHSKPQVTVANFNMYVSLAENLKGTHMSRFVEVLNESTEEINIDNFSNIIEKTASRLESKDVHIEMSFVFFIEKTAPASKVKSLMDYEVSFIGDLSNKSLDFQLKLVVPVKSLCPCSKKISDYGAHNQRSHVTSFIKLKDKSSISIVELIKLIESQASSDIYSLLKRPDEKVITEKAYENPKFVEDLVRDVANAFNNDERIDSYEVEAENFESIHNHSAYAKIIS